MVDVYLKDYKLMNNFDKAAKAYTEARKGINVKKNERIVLECKTTWCYEFARDIHGADIKAHEQVILELKSGYYSYYFARDIKGADIKAHEKVILELRDPNYSCYFAEDISGANIEEHFKVVFNFGNKYWLNRFIKKVNYKNTKVEEWLMYI